MKSKMDCVMKIIQIYYIIYIKQSESDFDN